MSKLHAAHLLHAAAPSPRTAPCERSPLAACSFGLVEVCSCGSVHLTLGALTLRLQPDALPELARALGEASRELALRGLTAGERRPARALS